MTDLLSELGQFDLEGTLGLLFVLQLLVESLHLVRQLLLLVVGTDLGPVLLRQALLLSQQHNEEEREYYHPCLIQGLFSKVPTYMYCMYIRFISFSVHAFTKHTSLPCELSQPVKITIVYIHT